MNATQFIKAGAQSGSIMMISDVMTQSILEKKNSSNIDHVRTLRWGLCGLTLHGPYFLVTFSKIDKYWGSVTSLPNVLKKTAFAQFTVFPGYLVLLFGYLGVLEGMKDPRDLGGKVYYRGLEAFGAGCVFWPVANVVNFKFVPPSFRVPYLAACQLPWNCFLSWRNG